MVFTVVPAEHRTYAALAVASYLPSMILSVYGSALAGAEDYRSNVLGSMVSNVLNLVGVGLTLWYGWGLVGLAGALLFSRVVDYAIRLAFYRRRFPTGVHKRLVRAPLPEDLRKRIFAFCCQSTVLLLISFIVWDRSELFFLKQFSTISEVAYYSLAFNIALQLTVLPQVFANAAGATMMTQYGRDPSLVGRITSTTVRYIAFLALPLMLTTAALSSPLLRVLYGEKYVSAIPALWISVLFMIPRAWLPPVQQLMMAIEKQSLLVKWSILCCSDCGIGSVTHSRKRGDGSRVGQWPCTNYRCFGHLVSGGADSSYFLTMEIPGEVAVMFRAVGRCCRDGIATPPVNCGCRGGCHGLPSRVRWNASAHRHRRGRRSRTAVGYSK